MCQGKVAGGFAVAAITLDCLTHFVIPSGNTANEVYKPNTYEHYDYLKYIYILIFLQLFGLKLDILVVEIFTLWVRHREASWNNLRFIATIHDK